MGNLIINQLIEDGNAYDLAQIIAHEFPNDKESATFLNRYAEIEELIGDNDNPFNPLVDESNHLSMNYIEHVKQILFSQQ